MALQRSLTKSLSGKQGRVAVEQLDHLYVVVGFLKDPLASEEANLGHFELCRKLEGCRQWLARCRASQKWLAEKYSTSSPAVTAEGEISSEVDVGSSEEVSTSSLEALASRFKK